MHLASDSHNFHPNVNIFIFQPLQKSRKTHEQVKTYASHVTLNKR